MKVKEFKIGGVKYLVEYVDQLVSGNDTLYGLHMPTESMIKLATKVADSKVGDDLRDIAFYHELLHAMFFMAGLNLDHAVEEDAVRRLSPFLKEYLDTVIFEKDKRVGRKR